MDKSIIDKVFYVNIKGSQVIYHHYHSPIYDLNLFKS